MNIRDNTVRVLLMTIVVILYVALLIYVEMPSLRDRYTINDDTRTNHFWMAQFQDKELFQNDLLTNYSRFFQPYGFIFVYFLFNKLIDPIWLSKLLPIFLFPLTGIFIFRLGRYINGNLAGFIFAVLFLNFRPFIQRFIGGNARSFFLPLLVIFLYYFVKEEDWKVMIVLVCQSLFYPISFLLSSFTYALSFLTLKSRKNNKFSFNVDKKRLILFSITLITCFFILLPKYIIPKDPALGGSFTLKEMKEMPEFYEGGRRPILPFDSLFKIIYKSISDPLILYFLIISVLFLWKDALKLPKQLWCFLIASLILYELARIFAYRLYTPGKYVIYSLPIFFFALLSINLPKILKKIKYKYVGICLVVVFILLSYHWHGSKIYQGLSQVKHNHQELYRFISLLPKDVLIAGHPRDMDEIPLFTQHKVFITYETANPHLVGYYKKIRERTYDFFDAYYSDSMDEIIEFSKKYQIDYLIVNREHFSKEYIKEANFYFEPFNSYIREKIKDKSSFVLNKIPSEDIIFEKDNIFIIKLNK